MPRYPVYVISKGRARIERGTAKFLARDGVDFRIVVEPQEADEYREVVGEEKVLVLPFSNLGQGSIPARNWVWQHAEEAGAARHWILDDNIREVRRLYKGERIPANSQLAFETVEDFVDRYANVGIGGLNYQKFVLPSTAKPFFLNVHVYSFMLVRNDLPFRWRGRYNEDTDLCLQTLAEGLCTVLVNVFMADKATTMTTKGGNTDELYAGDGRLEMARSLERAWPGVVSVKRRYGRPQHFVDWKKFDTPLISRPDVHLDRLPAVDERGAKLEAVREVRSPKLRRLQDEFEQETLA